MTDAVPEPVFYADGYPVTQTDNDPEEGVPQDLPDDAFAEFDPDTGEVCDE